MYHYSRKQVSTTATEELLLVVSKLLERVILRRLFEHLKSNPLRSPPTGNSTPPKLLSRRYYRISWCWWHLTKATWRHWPFWTCPPRSTQSITVFYFATPMVYTSIEWTLVG